ncbi:642_t:CDS:2 [Rhizophagus irregularis]|nr:642_t:CDS:2 [Rhizophagus irregularis]
MIFITSLQEEKGRSRTPYHRQEEGTSLSQNNTSLKRSEIQPQNFRQEDTHFRRIDTSNPHQQDTSYYTSLRRSGASNRDRSLSPYSLQEVSLSNRNKSCSPFSHHEDSLLNIREMKEKKGMLMKKVMEKIIEEMRVEKEIVKIAELRMEMSELTREVEELRSEKEASHQFDGWRNQTRTQYSLSPDPSSARYPNVRKHLELMNHEYKKAFWQILKLKKVLQNLYRHQRDAYITSLDPLKSKMNKQRTGINSRRKDKKEKWQSGFQHMVNIKDQKLVDLQPLVPWDDWVEGLEAIIDNSGYHLDEISESNTEKRWRSSIIQNVLRYADMIKESIQNIKIGRKRWYDDQLYIENDFKSPRNAPAWAISSSYHSG